MPYQDGTFGCPAEVGLQLVSGKWKGIISLNEQCLTRYRQRWSTH